MNRIDKEAQGYNSAASQTTASNYLNISTNDEKEWCTSKLATITTPKLNHFKSAASPQFNRNQFKKYQNDHQQQMKQIHQDSSTFIRNEIQHKRQIEDCNSFEDEKTLEEIIDRTSQDSQLLEKESKSCEGILNPDEEDAMKITGYRRSKARTYLCWLCICLTAGLLRLVLHWWRHWLLIATHSPCPLAEADRVLIQEDYQGKHKVYYIKDVVTLSLDEIKKMNPKGSKMVSNHLIMDNEIDEKNFHLSVHFSSGVFKHTDSVRVILCKQLRYVWDAQSQSFVKLTGLDVDIPSKYFHHVQGLSSHEQFARRLVYGLNEITVPYKGVVTLLFLEVLNPFYVFQIFSVILWFSYNYYYYAVVIIFMSAFGISMSIIQTKKNQDALYSTVQNSDHALVLTENGDVKDLKTQYLVPGDVIEIPSTGCTMQCDAVLLSGNCILDESMLTGESVPVTKTPLPIKRDLIFDKKEHSRHTLFCGTKVIQTRYIGSEKVLAVAINTGNITAKGGLIRSILYPPPVDYKFEQDSYKFIALLGLIAFIGFFYTLISKILRGVDAVKILVESLDLITIVVPPALPAAMTVGRYYAQQRLEKKKIFCISPRSINVSGSIDCVCFDKTGTLTEDGLDMWGVVPKSETNYFQMPLRQIERLPVDNFLFGMVTCHSITIMNGERKGDPLDLKMFESTGWILEDANVPDGNKYDLLFPTIVRQPKSNRISTDSMAESLSDFRKGSVDDLLADVGGSNDIGIVREFPFTSALQRMSVVTRRLTDDHFNVYCKGSPEMIHTLSKPSTLPENYFSQLDVYAQQGFRIIALAYKPLEKKMSYPKVQRIGRDKIECDLDFLGFVILENRLKPDTTDVIKSLTLANIRTIMVTGDNILTALSVARDCGIVGKKQSVITVNTRSNTENPDKYELYFNLIGAVTPSEQIQNGNGDICSLNTHSSSIASLETCDTWTHRDVELGLTDVTPTNETNEKSVFGEKKMFPDYPSNNYRFAMVGKTWSIVREHFPEYVQRFVTRGAIFARMSPDQKQSLIMELQDVNYYVAMCGDGANDCGALKVAHTGISLSETESSIASPFTSRNPTITCVPSVIREGRAALVTSFGIFKYMAAYSLCQFISVLILYSIDSNLTDKQFLYIDLGLISIFAFFFGKTEAYDGPLVKQPPLNSLISIVPMASIILHLILVIIFQVAGWFYLLSQSWFKPFEPDPDPEGNHLGCLENYTIFVISCFQYIILAFVFSKGAPYRKTIISNIPFCLSLLINLALVVYLTLYPANWLAESFELVMPPDMNFRYLMVLFGVANFIISLILESVFVEYLLFKKIRHYFYKIEKSHRKYLTIENELRQNIKWPPLSDFSNCISSTEYDKPSPTSYAEISAEHQIDIKAPENSVLNSFFDIVKIEVDNKTQQLQHLQFQEKESIDENMSLSDIYSESFYESAINDETIFDEFSSENDISLTRSQQSVNLNSNNRNSMPAAHSSQSSSVSPLPELAISLFDRKIPLPPSLTVSNNSSTKELHHNASSSSPSPSPSSSLSLVAPLPSIGFEKSHHQPNSVSSLSNSDNKNNNNNNNNFSNNYNNNNNNINASALSSNSKNNISIAQPDSYLTSIEFNNKSFRGEES